MTLLLVGIVAVILVILVAAFLTFRRGQDDDHDEAGGRWAFRDRVRSAGRDGHWRGPVQELERAPRSERDEPSRRAGERRRGYDEAAPAYGTRRPGRDQPGGRGYPAGRAGGPDTAGYPASRGRGTRGTESPPRRPGGRADGYDTGGFDTGGFETVSYDSGPRELYDTGPSPAAAGRMPPQSAGRDFTPEHDDDPALTDSDVFPRIRTDIPPAASSSRSASKPHNKPPAPAKSRSRQSRSSKRGDDDDWPSTEWDKLSDEQYWAELSADKPLATTARTAQPSPAKDAMAAPGVAQPKPAQLNPARTPGQPSSGSANPAPAKPAQSRPAPTRPAGTPPGRPAAAPTGPGKPPPDRESVAPRRRARPQEHTEVLPLRNRPRPAAAAAPSPPPQAGEPSMAVLASLANTPPARRPEPMPNADDDPLTSPSFSRQAVPTQDSRSYRTAGRDRPRGSTGDYPSGRYPTGSYPNGSSATGSYPNGSSATGSYPSGSYPSGSYPAGGGANGGGSRANGGTGPHGYQAGEHTNPSGAYPAIRPGERQPATPPATQAVPLSAPPPAPPRAPTGNPYGSYVDSAPAATGSHAAGYPEDRSRADGRYGGYPASSGLGYPEPPVRQPTGPDPAGSLPGRDSGWHSAPLPAGPDASADPASHYLYTGGTGYPDTAGYGAGPAAAEPGYPPAGYADPAGYAEPAGYADPAGYATGPYNGAGYPDGYGTDPYDPDAYGGYRPRQA
jgi:hypothetical protein